MILFFQTLSMKTRLVAVLVSFFLVFCVFYAFHNTPWFLVQLKQYSPDHSLPDQLFWYSPRDLHQILGAWGLVGRDFYRTTLFPLDLVFPVLYSAFFFVSILYMLKKVNPKGAWWYLLPVLPAAGGLCDLLESLGVFASSVLYPDRWDWLGVATGSMTTAKWGFMSLNLGLLVFLALWHWGQRWKHLLRPEP